MNSQQLIDVNEGARITGLRTQTLYRLAREGKVKSYRVLGRSLRFVEEDLRALIHEKPAAISRAVILR